MLTFLTPFFEFLFPPICIVCKKPGSRICPQCANRYLIKSLPECGLCRQLSINSRTHQPCKKAFPIDHLFVLWIYTRLPREIMRNIKVSLEFGLIDKTIELAKERIKKLLVDTDFLIPVPSDPRRFRKRGFNQSELICRRITSLTDTPYLNYLTKSRSTKHQAGKSKSERVEQQEDLFSARDEIKHIIKDKEILLIDDVCTTGTTIKNCAKSIRKFRPRTLNALVLFRGKKLGSTRTPQKLKTPRTPKVRSNPYTQHTYLNIQMKPDRLCYLRNCLQC